LANAGHPPPLVHSRHGVRAIDGHSPLLGIRARGAVEIDFVLEPDDTLMLYTDGLVELRTETFDESFGRLSRAAAVVEPDLEAFASRMLTEVGPAEPSDDIALVVIRRRGLTPVGGRPSGTPALAVDRDALATVRHTVTGYARGSGLDDQAVNDLVLIANELAANVVLHGGGAGELFLWRASGLIFCQVTDHGPGMAEPERVGTVAVDQHTVTGRGLWLIRQMSDSVDIASGPDGTTVTVGLRLSG
jgi:anti-sigma regulatory factor (Ser/Thr protein kinase)